jgi:hypothetical protein
MEKATALGFAARTVAITGNQFEAGATLIWVKFLPVV